MRVGKLSYRALVLFSALAMIGCAAPGASKIDYYPPATTATNNNEIVVNDSFDVVWDRLVGRLAKGFFVINNIDKDSRLINVSFMTESPEDFIDCGQSKRNFKYKNEERTYRYKVAEDSVYKVTSTWGPYNNLPSVTQVSRDTSLEGRINIYIAPKPPNETKVSANVRYIFEIEVSGTAVAYNAFGTPQQNITIPKNNYDYSFTTNEYSTFGQGADDSITCGPTGALERSILDFAKP